jgi:hypothetical protein
MDLSSEHARWPKDGGSFGNTQVVTTALVCELNRRD